MRLFTLSVAVVLFLSACTMAPKTPTPTGNSTTGTSASTTGTSAAAGPQKTVATPTFGSGKTQVEIFADFQCPACIVFNDSIQPILEEFAQSGKITITYRQYPLTNIHKNAMADANAALCSVEQDKYMQYKKALYAMEKEKAGAAVSDGERIAIAQGVGIETGEFGQCLADKRYYDQVAADMKLGDKKLVSGTPTIFLDGVKLDMGLFKDIESFKSFLQSRIK